MILVPTIKGISSRMSSKKPSPAAAKFKKAPGAPRRFKSAYMFFSIAKHKEIRELNHEKMPTTEVAKMVSKAWKSQRPEERAVWDEMARKDKERFQREKSCYSGPWKVPIQKSSKKILPATGFNEFCKEHRTLVQTANPNATNIEISGILSKMWNEAGPIIKKQYAAKVVDQRSKKEHSTNAADGQDCNQSFADSSEALDASNSSIDCDMSDNSSEWGDNSSGFVTQAPTKTVAAVAASRSVSTDQPNASFTAGIPAQQPLSYAPMLCGLVPLTETDTGNFLAAAAHLDGMMEPLPLEGISQETALAEQQQIALGVHHVLLSLPDPQCSEYDLPEAASFQAFHSFR